MTSLVDVVSPGSGHAGSGLRWPGHAVTVAARESSLARELGAHRLLPRRVDC